MQRRRFLYAGAMTAGAVTAGTVGGGSASAVPRRSVRTGFDVVARAGYAAFSGQKVGLIANPTSVTGELRHEVDVMHGADEVDLIAVFGPEHGFRGTAQAGGSEGYYTDEKTGLPVYDLYAKTVDQAAQLIEQSGVDILAFDIQDIGARFYTYIWTMYYAMQAAATVGVPFYVLDRPNPLGGRAATGPVLNMRWATGVGRAPIAQQHGMTVAELASLLNAEFLDGAVDLHMQTVQGWRRGMTFAETGLPWVLPSPNIPTVNSALVYPGTGMFEGTNLSEGRGTTKPFETIGAPYVDYRWAQEMSTQKLPGVQFREAYFVPTFNKFVGETCAGVELHVSDERAFDPIRTAVAMLIAVRRLYPDFAWRYDTGDPVDPYWIDKLTGSDGVRNAIDAGKGTDAVIDGWRNQLRDFSRIRARYLQY